ncbi:MAG: maleylpyruvate isomerase family mycothiol-dependent enzyme [Actinomycetota bacterium]
MSSLSEVLADFRAECDALDAVLVALDEDGWHKETPAVGWDTRDTVGHLADTSDIMFNSVTGTGPDLMEQAQLASEISGVQWDGPDAVDAFTAVQMQKVRQVPWNEVHEWWHRATDRLIDTIAGLDEGGRYRWGPNMISPKSLVSARQMETWAHSLDIHAAAGVPYTDTDRIYHVAFLGLRAMPHAFTLERKEMPGAIRLELVSPSGAQWSLGPDDAPTVISGSASDFCRVVARRDRDGAAERLVGAGPDAALAIEHGRAFL